MSSRILLEVAVATLADAQTAQAAGADRLELNAALELGGLTPSIGTVELVKAACRIPVIAMVRPRPGGFVYSSAERATMERDCDHLLAAGVAGVAFGFLSADRTIDVSATRAFVNRIGSGPECVFHRAFDLTPDPAVALATLIDLGVTRVLTSGQATAAPDGTTVIKRLVIQAANRTEILPGAGITPENVAQLIADTGVHQVHGSLSVVRSDPGQPVCPGEYRVTCAKRVAAARRAIDALL